MDTLYAIYRFLDTIAIIVRNNKNLSTRIYYILVFLKLKLFPKTNSIYFLGNKIYFPDYKSLLASIEEVFFYKSYFFETKSKSPTIVDCGSNIGITALYFKFIFPDSFITCIEAVPKTFKYLKKNVTHLSNLRIINRAITKSGKAKYIYISKNKDACNLNDSSYKSRWSKKTKFDKIKANGIKLSSLIVKPLDCLVLDIEGDEDEILLDLKENRKLELIDNIFVEFHNYRNNSLSKIISILSESGFKIIPGSGVRPPYQIYKNKFYSLPIYAYRV